MLVCPLCHRALEPTATLCPFDGQKGRRAALCPVPGALKKRFDVGNAFAHGDGSTTYHASEREPARTGLLKVLRPPGEALLAERQRFRRELLKLSALETPHVARPLASGEIDDTTWIFREYLEGSPLRVKLSDGAPMPQREALSVAAQLVVGLDDLHRAGLLHRDIQPGHVLLRSGANGALHALLIDAGQVTAHEVSGHGTVLGTPGYIAPEQQEGKLVSFRSDLYALGCVIYEMLTGRRAFAGDSVQAVLTAQLKGELPKMPDDLPSNVGALLKSLLAREPQERPFSAQKLRRTLDPYLLDGVHVNRQPPQTPGAGQDPKRSLPPQPPLSLRPPDAARAPEGALRPGKGTSRIPPPPPPTHSASVAPPPTHAASVAPPPLAKPSAVSLPPSGAALPSARATLPLGSQAPRPSALPPAPKASLPPTARASSMPPPGQYKPAPAPSTPDATQQLDLAQVVEVAQTKSARSVAPPAPHRPSRAPSTPDRTQALELDQLLEVAVGRAAPADMARTSTPPPRPSMAPEKKTADMTQPIRLEQILAVADARIRELEQKAKLSAPNTSSKAFEDTDLDIDVAPPAEPKPHANDAIARAIAEEDEDDDDLIGADGHAFGLQAGAPTGPQKRASAPIPEPLPSIIVDSQPPPPMRSSAALKSTLQGVAPPANLPAEEAGPALDTPTAVKVAAESPKLDSANLTLPREPVSAAEAAQRLGYDTVRAPAATSGRNKKIAYGVAAAALLGLVMVRVSARQGDAPEEKPAAVVAKQEPEVVAQAPVKAAEPAVAPLAEAPKKDEEAVAQVAALPPPPAAPVVEAAPAPAAQAAALPKAEEPRPRVREERVGRAREKDRDEALTSEAKLARWAKARDEARAHYAAKRYGQAASSYEEAARFNPSHAGTFAGLGAARLQTGDTRGASQAYQKAIQLSPTTSGFHAALGKTYMTAGDRAKAKAAYRRALALDPKNEAAKQALNDLE